MSYIIIFIICIIIWGVLYKLLGTKKKDIETLKENKELGEMVKKFPSNEEIGKSILKALNNETTVVKQTEGKETLYVVATNSILLGKGEENYTRIQTIAHECLHSVQNKKIQWFNFIYSNLFFITYIVLLILVITKIVKTPFLTFPIILILSFVYYIIRSNLEAEAMYKAPFLAKQYIENQKKISKEETEKLIQEYQKITNIGVPFTELALFSSCMIKILFFLIVAFVVNNLG